MSNPEADAEFEADAKFEADLALAYTDDPQAFALAPLTGCTGCTCRPVIVAADRLGYFDCPQHGLTAQVDRLQAENEQLREALPDSGALSEGS